MVVGQRRGPSPIRASPRDGRMSQHPQQDRQEEFMSPLSPSRRDLLATAATAAAVSFIPSALVAATSGDTILPFTASFSKDQLDDLRRRVAATRWPDKETVADASQGVQLATIQKLAAYWATDYDWQRM